MSKPDGSKPDATANRARLARLVDERCSGTLDASANQELHALLAGSEDLRRSYWEAINLHVDLHWLLAEDRPASPPSVQDAAITAAPSRTITSPTWQAAALAASVLAAVVGATYLWPGAQEPPPSDPASAPAAIAANAQLKPLAADSVWRTGRPGDRNPSVLRYGDTVHADAGVVEMRLGDAIGVLRAPVVLQLLASDRVRLLHGRVTVTAPELTNGFTVETPAAEVVDLGTVFSVEAAEQGTDLVVFGGKVNLKVPQAGRDANAPQQESLMLVGGEAIHVSQEGAFSRVASVRSSVDPMVPLDARRVAAIESVTDNSSRQEDWSFYEIVVRGMREDAPAYVDRFHEWNGVTPDGMPKYLAGGDYVKMFNDDKATEDLRVEIVVAQRAAIYVLLDNRVEAPGWLVDSFDDTGDKIGMDESPHDTANRFAANDQFAQVGAGESIDRVHSIWRRVAVAGERVVLGPNGLLPASERSDTRPRYIPANMYGVVAAPLDERPSVTSDRDDAHPTDQREGSP